MITLQKHKNDVWEIKINRPEKANSLSSSMLEELLSIFDKAAEARGVVLTGQGTTFSAGADLNEVKSGLAISPIWEKLSILACDIRICVSKARFFYPVMKMGFLPQPSDPNRLIRLIGPSRAKLMLVAGEKIDADTAYRFGLVDEIVEDKELIDRAHTLLSASLSANQNHVSSIKKLLS